MSLDDLNGFVRAFLALGVEKRFKASREEKAFVRRLLGSRLGVLERRKRRLLREQEALRRALERLR